jgi:hypothetical protein
MSFLTQLFAAKKKPRPQRLLTLPFAGAMPLGIATYCLCSKSYTELQRYIMAHYVTHKNRTTCDVVPFPAVKDDEPDKKSMMDYVSDFTNRWGCYYEPEKMTQVSGALLRTSRGVFFLDIVAGCIFAAADSKVTPDVREWHDEIENSENENLRRKNAMHLKMACIMALLQMLLADIEGLLDDNMKLHDVQFRLCEALNNENLVRADMAKLVQEESYRDFDNFNLGIDPGFKTFMKRKTEEGYCTHYICDKPADEKQIIETLGYHIDITMNYFNLVLVHAKKKRLCLCPGVWRPVFDLCYTIK